MTSAIVEEKPLAEGTAKIIADSWNVSEVAYLDMLKNSFRGLRWLANWPCNVAFVVNNKREM